MNNKLQKNMKQRNDKKRKKKCEIYYLFKKIEAKEIIYELKKFWSPIKKAGMTRKKSCTS